MSDIQWAVDHMWYSQQFLPTIHTACTGLGLVSTIASSVEVKIPAHLHPRPPSAHQPTIFSAIHGPASSRSGPRPGFWVNSKIMQTCTPGPAKAVDSVDSVDILCRYRCCSPVSACCSQALLRALCSPRRAREPVLRSQARRANTLSCTNMHVSCSRSTLRHAAT